MKKKTKKRIKRSRSKEPSNGEGAHRWRLCPLGEHWVVTHPLRIPPSETHPEGGVTTRRGHCAKNPSGMDQLYADEIHEIDRRHFFRLKNGPSSDLGEYENGDQFDPLIVGWVRYWNEVLSPDDPLDPNVVKALIATESSFRPDSLADRKRPNSARGLMQITNDSRKALGDEEGD